MAHLGFAGLTSARWLVDGIVGALFAGFVGILFLGYLAPAIPYDTLAPAPLAAALALLCWANFDEDRKSCAVPLSRPESK